MTQRRRFGSLRRLPSGRYQARYRDAAGREHTAPNTFATKTEANRWLILVEADLHRGEWRDPSLGQVTFDEWADHWWATTVDLRPSTRDRYAVVLERYLRPEFGGTPLGQITPVDVRSWLAELNATALSPATVRKGFMVLRRILEVAVQSDAIIRNPCAGIRPPVEPRREMRFMDPDEVATLADAIGERYRALVLVGSYCGLRWGELAGLRRGRVNLLRRSLTVVEQVQELNDGTLSWGPPKTAASRRAVPVPAFVADVLAEHLALYSEPGEQGLVFTGPHCGVLRSSLFRRRMWAPACVTSGLGSMVKVDGRRRYEGLRIHDMRHTAVALAIATGAHPKAIQERMGHSSVSITLDRYGHLLPGQGEAIADGLDTLGRAAQPPESGQFARLGA